MQKTSWLYIGNFGSPINSDPSTRPTQIEADALNGYSATGIHELIPTEVTGPTPVFTDKDGNLIWLTSYNADEIVRIPDGTPGSSFSYTLPSGDVTDAVITTFLIADFTVAVPTPDPDVPGFEDVTRQGILLQDSLGNLFVIPRGQDPEAWDDITSLSKITVNSVTLQGASTPMATNGWDPTILNNIVIVCFARGTALRSADGDVAVETLQKGDLIWTRDAGLQPVAWIGSTKLSSVVLAALPNLRPIRIAAGALGAGVPAKDLIVSPQHRILVRSVVAQRMFGSEEVLVAAKHLRALEGVEIAHDVTEVEYFHVMFDTHQVVMSNGAETESMYTGPQAIKALAPAALEEIFMIFPQLRDLDSADPAPAARPLVSGRHSKRLAERLSKNHKSVISAS